MDKETLLLRIKNEFPDLCWSTHRFLTHGWDHFVVVLDNRLIFRTARDNPSDLRSNLSDEIRLMDYLDGQIKANIPKYEYISKDGLVAGYEMLGGKELTPALFKELDPSEKESFISQVSDFLNDLHSVPVSDARQLNVRQDTPEKDHESLVRKSERLLFTRLDGEEIKAINELFDGLESAIEGSFQNVLTHNDLGQEHILWDSSEIGVIDFSDCVIGDPAIDFSGLLDYGDDVLARVHENYMVPHDDGLLQRAALYHKRIPVFLMNHALECMPCDFKEGRRLFRKRLKLDK
jgi:aminoglycoside 2''-phosphotransferase